MRKIILLALMTITACGYAQVHDYGHNPFKSIGKEAKIVTLSDGRYDEIFEDDTLRRIGSVMFNTVTNKIQYFITKDNDATASIDIKRPKQSSRFMSVDPMFKKYNDMCPYAFVANNPILFVDRDGREVFAYSVESKALVLKTLNYAFGKTNCFGFAGNKLISDGDPPQNMTSEQALLYKYFSETILTSKTPTIVKTNTTVMEHTNADGKDVSLLVGDYSGAETAYFPTTYSYRDDDADVKSITNSVPAEQQIILAPGMMAKGGINLEIEGGARPLFGMDHALLHEFAHGIMNTIMNEYEGKYNGQDFNKMTPTQREDWAIKYTNTLLKSMKQPLEDGDGQHHRNDGEKPDQKPDPLSK